MAGPLRWPVEPGSRVGPFLLGMGVNAALQVVQKMGSLDRAEFSFDEKHPFETDLSLRLPSMGLQLCFDGFQQDLRVIAVCLQSQAPLDDEMPEALRLPSLLYGGCVFASSARPPPCLRDVYSVFGPTWIGDFRPGGRAAYLLRYPGLTFEFLLPEDLVDTLDRGEHPMDLPGLPPTAASRLWVFASEADSFLSPVAVMPDMPEAVVVRPAVGLELQGRMLLFGSMPQDVFSDFGPPEQVCVKNVDAVRIHSVREPVSRTAGPDYYYNYFNLGLDVLFDGRTHLVKKVVLHTNAPTHERFSRYSRCFFEIPIGPPSGSVKQHEVAATAASSPACLTLDSPKPPPACEEPEEQGPKLSPGEDLREGETCEEKLQSNDCEDEDLELRKKKKAGKKAKGQEAKGSGRLPAGSSEASPSWSPASPEPSPIVTLEVKRGTGEPDTWDDLPPPAVPLDSPDCSTDPVRDNKVEAVPRPNDTTAGVNIDVRWPWHEIQEVFERSTGCSCGKPLVMSQSGCTPFGSTHFYTYPGLVFEVMQNGFLASLTVFSVPPEQLPSVFQPLFRGSAVAQSMLGVP